MRLIALPLLAVVSLAWAEPIGPVSPIRFTAPRSGLLHVSLHRDYALLPGDLTVVGWTEQRRAFVPENTQTHPGVWAFRTGLVERGKTYTIHATQPGEVDFELLDAPDGKEADRAIAAGMSWLIRAGDAWLANQPRQGAITRPGVTQHPEARACIACHITQFTTRGYLTAVRNGYAAQAPVALAGVMQRLRDNPRPLPGHAGVNWARVIYSARTVSSRLPVLLDMHGRKHEDRELILGAARFLLLADDCGAGLRDEADGARPEVSGFEIGLQSWQTFRLAEQLEPGDSRWAQQSACLAKHLEQTKPVNTIDAAWQIIALAQMGLPTKTAVTQLLRHQQADGRFALTLDRTAPAADFISYHVLYALAVAGYRGAETERLAAYAVRQQRPDGSWKGAPEYKGFDTPFRETQFAVMALSELHKRPAPAAIPPRQFSRQNPPDPWRVKDRGGYQQELVARMAVESNPALVDALAASLDENLAQLREWQRAIRRPAEQHRVEAALRADSERQAQLLAAALETGSPLAKKQILAALAKVPGVDGFPARPRVGNDGEASQILSDPGQRLERAIRECLKDDELTVAAIRAGTALSDTLSPHFTLALLRLARSQGDAILEAYGAGRRGRLVLTRDGQYPAELVILLTQLLREREPRSLAIVLPLLAAVEPGDGLTREMDLQGAMDALLRAHPTAEVIAAAAVFPRLADGPLMRTQVLAAMSSNDIALIRAAVDVVVDHFVTNPNLAAMTAQFFKHSQGLSRRMLLDSLDPSRVRFRLDLVNVYSPPRFEVPADANILALEFVQEFVLSSLGSGDPLVRATALDLTRKHERLRRAPVIQTMFAQLNKAEPPPALDFEFFRQRIQPILEKPAADGRSCVMCHASNARFPLRADPRANFHAVASKVNLADPTASAVLIKPLLPGVTFDGDVFRTSHNGGERWRGKTGSVEYQTILEWIRGSGSGSGGGSGGPALP